MLRFAGGFFSVLLVWVRRVEKDRLWKLGEKADVPFLVLFAIVIWGAAQILNTPMIVVYRFGIYVTCLHGLRPLQF